ncbi:MAG TPA: hypothetical protein VFX68_03105 [Sulfuricurvum sp.]|nr:hypothetical protein [Sulfuricurvum sp.]
MTTPDFFNDVNPITLRDPLSNVLGAARDGIITYTYTDVVKLAGHSCPTVAGAYLMVQDGLKALYGEATPVRGEIKVFMSGMLGEGVVGVMANVASMITGATDVSGFHGLNGKFDRRNLLFYGADIEGEMALERMDTGVRVTLTYDPSSILPDPQMKELMMKVMSGSADEQDCQRFGEVWQDRVRRIMLEGQQSSLLVKTIIVKNI